VSEAGKAGNRAWMIVSKPVREPFRDGSTVLVRTLIRRLPERFRLTYLGDPERPLRSGAADDVLPVPPMPLSPGLWQKARVLTCLAHPCRRRLPLHFFFTPNRVTSSVLALLQRLSPRRTVLQDLTSSHDAARFARLLRSLSAVVVHSTHARDALLNAGLAPDRVVRIYPGVPASDPVDDPEHDRRLLYAGDLDPRVVDRLLALGRALKRPELQGWKLCIASRSKSPDDRYHRDRLREALREESVSESIELQGEVGDMDALLRRSSLQLFLADHVRRKVDLPLVLLEGMARGIPLLAVDAAPVAEIFERGREHGLCPGSAASADEIVDTVLGAVARGGLLAQWGRAARELAAREFCADRMAREYASLYDELGHDDVDHL
jgi:glycosyltransferase involved in cell wall biosynthesis